MVVLAHQHGVDLAIQIRSPDGVVVEQDGPDQAFGTEVVLLENAQPANATYEIFVRPVLNGVAPHFRLQRLERPTPAEYAAAEALSRMSREWLRGAPASAVLPTAEIAARSGARLRDWGINGGIDILTRSGQAARLRDFLRTHVSASDPADISNRIYRDYLLANALWNSFQIDEALRVIESVGKDIAENPEWSRVPSPTRRWLEIKVRTSLGAIRIFAGRNRGDRHLMQQGGDLIAATLKALGNDADDSLRAHLTEYLAGYYSFVFDRSSNLTSALYRQAAALYEKAGDNLSLAAIRNNQAYAELGRGNVQRALHLYLETADLQKTSRHLEGQAHIRARLGYVYYTLGDYRRGEIRLKEAIELYREIDLPLRIIHNQLQLAELLHADQRSLEALAILDELRAKFPNELSLENRLRLATQLATIHIDRNEITRAERVLARVGPAEQFDVRNYTSLQVAVRLYYLLDYEIARARIELTAGDHSAALVRIDRALALLGESNREPLQQLQLLHIQLSVLGRMDDPHHFAETEERALGLIEAIRGSIDFHTQGPTWTARTNDVTKLIVSYHLSRYERTRSAADFERAFSLLQTSRARNLRDVRAATAAGEQSHADDVRARELQRAYQELVSATLLEQSSESLERRLAKAEEQHQLSASKIPVIRGLLEVMSANSIRERLDAHTEVRVLIPNESGSQAVVLTRDDMQVMRLPGENVLKPLVVGALRELHGQDPGLKLTHQLARLLFPGEASARSQLLIEADGVFAAIPYSILLDLRFAGESTSAVAVVPSLSEMFANDSIAERAHASRSRKELVVFADPAFDLAAEMSGDAQARSAFGRLPYSRVEAESISTYFSRSGVVAFSGKAATIDNILGQDSRNARVLHIAAHGFASPSDAFVVGLGLASESTGAGSGLFTVRHIETARYENELIVISACDSGQGRLLDGEGVMSIARAFLASGAKATLSTMWPVSDRANAEFMKEFYFALTAGRADPATALLRAQRKMKQSRLFAHPHYWGGFVLHVVNGHYRPYEVH